MTASDVLESIRAFGADVIQRPDGSLVLRGRSRVPKDLAAQARERADDLRAILRKWRIGPSHAFTVATSNLADADRSVCIACGAGVELHGNPASDSWRIIPDEDLEAVENVKVTFVLEVAERIARAAENGEAR